MFLCGDHCSQRAELYLLLSHPLSKDHTSDSGHVFWGLPVTIIWIILGLKEANFVNLADWMGGGDYVMYMPYRGICI